MLSNSIPANYADSPATRWLPFRDRDCLLKDVNTIKCRVIPRHPSMIIVRKVFFLCDRDRHKDWLPDRIAFKSYVYREHLRDRLDYRFVNRIRDAVPNRINNYDGIYSRPREPVQPEMASSNKTCRHTEQQ